MSDIVERLRGFGKNVLNGPDVCKVCDEAAAEIARLRKDYEGIRQIASAQHKEIERLRDIGDRQREQLDTLGEVLRNGETLNVIDNLNDEVKRLRTLLDNVEHVLEAMNADVRLSDHGNGVMSLDRIR